MHQDLPGEMALAILLSKAQDKSGATVLVSKSHRWPRVLNYIPFLRPKYLDKFTVGLTGVPGTTYFLSTSTWHGRAAAKSEMNTSVIVSFLPANTPYRAQRLPPESLVDRLGPRLRSLWEAASAPDHVRQTPPATKDLQDILECRPRISRFSPWYLAIGLATSLNQLVMLWRKLKHVGRRVKRSHGSSPAASK